MTWRELFVRPYLTDADVVWLKDPRAYFNSGTYALADALVGCCSLNRPS